MITKITIKRLFDRMDIESGESTPEYQLTAEYADGQIIKLKELTLEALLAWVGKYFYGPEVQK